MRGFGTWQESDAYEDRNELPCQCGAVYPRHAIDHLSAVFIGGKATDCTACQPNGERARRIKAIANRIEATLFRHRNGKRIVHRDVAVRYLQRFGGHTFSVQAEVDDCQVHLKNANGEVIAVVSYLDKYPKPPAERTFADMPF